VEFLHPGEHMVRKYSRDTDVSVTHRTSCLIFYPIIYYRQQQVTSHPLSGFFLIWVFGGLFFLEGGVGLVCWLLFFTLHIDALFSFRSLLPLVLSMCSLTVWSAPLSCNSESLSAFNCLHFSVHTAVFQKKLLHHACLTPLQKNFSSISMLQSS